MKIFSICFFAVFFLTVGAVAQTAADTTSQTTADTVSQTAADTSAADTAAEVQEAASALPVPSRTIQVTKGTEFAVECMGVGWVYLGEPLMAEGEERLSYVERKQTLFTTLFIVRAEKAGTTIAHLYRTDFVANKPVDDYLEVVISHASAGPAALGTERPPSVPETISATTASLFKRDADNRAARAEIASLLQTAQREAAAKNFADAAAHVSEYLSQTNENAAEALYLQGQIYEASSPIRNLQAAYSAYQLLIDSYPESSLWDSAVSRRTYLNRYYFRIY